MRITLLGVGAFAMVLFAFLGEILWQNPTRTTLQCRRSTNICKLTQLRRNQSHTWPVALDSLAGARVVYPVHGVGNRGGPGGYQIYIYDWHANYFFTEYDSISAADAVNKKINGFLTDKNQPELVIVRDESNLNLVAWILMIVMPIFVIGMLLFAWRKTSACMKVIIPNNALRSHNSSSLPINSHRCLAPGITMTARKIL